MQISKFNARKINAGKTSSHWGKDFLTSLLGTTLSIVLTFGTSALLEHKMKADIQRQTAMMVIHDIDASVEQVEDIANYEDEKNQAVQYVLAHLDQIDALPADTLALALKMIADTDGDNTIFDDSKEKIFNSSQDIWSNLDNMAFVDNMERFYRERSYLQNQIALDPIFVEPITFDEYSQMKYNSPASDHSLDYAAILKEKLMEPRVRFHIDYSMSRARAYRSFAQRWRDISDRNKFIMNIDDAELAEYIKDSQRSGEPVGRRELIGQWERKVNGRDDYYCEYLQNGSFRQELREHYGNVFYDGDILWTIKNGGTWRIKGDTLFMVHDPQSSEVLVDRSGVTYRPEMRDSVENFISRYFDVKRATERLRKELEIHPQTDTIYATTNKKHDKLEMIVGRDQNGSVTCRYLKRRSGGSASDK